MQLHKLRKGGMSKKDRSVVAKSRAQSAIDLLQSEQQAPQLQQQPGMLGAPSPDDELVRALMMRKTMQPL